VGFDQDRTGEAEQGFGVGEHADDVGAAFDLLVEPFDGYLEPPERSWLWAAVLRSGRCR
jgi:hypothetical protein